MRLVDFSKARCICVQDIGALKFYAGIHICNTLYFIMQQKPLRIYHYPYFRTPFLYTWCHHITVNSRPPDLPSTACNHLCHRCLQIVLPPAHHSPPLPSRVPEKKKLPLSTIPACSAQPPPPTPSLPWPFFRASPPRHNNHGISLCHILLFLFLSGWHGLLFSLVVGG